MDDVQNVHIKGDVRIQFISSRIRMQNPKLVRFENVYIDCTAQCEAAAAAAMADETSTTTEAKITTDTHNNEEKIAYT